MPPYLTATSFVLALAATTWAGADPAVLSDKVTQENFNKVQVGMTEDQVKELLGAPTRTKPFAGALIYTWQDTMTVVSIHFKNGKVTLRQGVGFKKPGTEPPPSKTDTPPKKTDTPPKGTDTPPKGTDTPPGEGKEFTPKNGIFTAVMPAGNKTSQRTQVLVIRKHKVPIEQSMSISNGTIFVGASIGIPAVVMRDIPAGERFDILRDALVKHIKGKVTEEKDIMQDPVVGKEYQIELLNGAARMQVFTIAGWVVYGIVEGKTMEDVTSKKADAFFSSLKLTDKAKETFRNVKR